MFIRCIFCHHAFPANETLEHVRFGRRVAFDPARGRLWVVCGACRRWTLEPIEERWEALEELERLTTDRARLLSRTEHIALLRAGDLDVVRVGRAGLNEEAWWRYGRVLTARHRRHQWIAGSMAVISTGVAIGSIAGAGLGVFGLLNTAGLAPVLVREWKFRAKAWIGEAVCARCGAVLRQVAFRDTERVILADAGERIALRFRCYRCGRKHADAGYRFTERDGERLLRRVLAYHNFEGGSGKRVARATALIDEAGSARALARHIAERGPEQKHLDPTRRIALEIAINDEVEQRLLELELEQLEAQWREAEELAVIADGELTPMPLLEVLRRRLGRSQDLDGRAPTRPDRAGG